MIEFNLKRSDGKDFTIDVPETLREVRLSQKIDFNVAFRNVFTFLTEVDAEENPTWFLNRNYYLYLMGQCISEFLGQDLNAILQTDVSSLLDEEGNMLPHVIEEHINMFNDSDYVIPTETIDNVYTRLFEHIHVLIDSYEFSEHRLKSNGFSFEHDGTKYYVPKRYINTLTKAETSEPVSVHQVVECFEVMRWAGDQKKLGKDGDGSITYTEFLQVIAIFSRKEGETFPLKHEDTVKFIETRAAELQTINMQDAMDVFFCLSGTTKGLEKFEATRGFLKEFLLEAQSQNGRLMSKNEMKKFGQEQASSL